MRTVPRIGFRLATAMLMAASPARADQTQPARGQDVIAVLDGPAGVSYGYELGTERCPGGAQGEKPGCPMTLRLVEKGRVLDRVTLEYPSCGEAQRFPVDSLFGVARDVRAWMTAGPGCQVGVAVQPVRVAPNEMAALVTQRAGSEHVTWRHGLFLGQKGKLRALWSDREENASNVDVRVLAAARGTEDVAVINVVKQESDDLVAERIRVKRLHWEPAAGYLTSSPMPDAEFPLFLTYVGPFKTVAAAREAGDRRHPDCVVPFGVLPGELFPGLGLRGYLRGAVLVSREEATARKASAGSCPKALTPRIIEYVPKVEYTPRR